MVNYNSPHTHKKNPKFKSILNYGRQLDDFGPSLFIRVILE